MSDLKEVIAELRRAIERLVPHVHPNYLGMIDNINRLVADAAERSLSPLRIEPCRHRVSVTPECEIGGVQCRECGLLIPREVVRAIELWIESHQNDVY